MEFLKITQGKAQWLFPCEHTALCRYSLDQERKKQYQINALNQLGQIDFNMNHIDFKSAPHD